LRRPALASGVLTLVAAILLALPTAADAATYIAADHFGRNISNGWGSTDPGGTYSYTGPASDFWVSTSSYARGLGYMRVPGRGVSRGALLAQTRGADVQLGLSVFISAADGDGPFSVYAVARSSAMGEVRAKLVYNRDCSVWTGGSLWANGREQALGALAVVPNARWCGPNRSSRTVSLQMAVTGSTLRIKAWPSGGSVPGAWSWSARSASLPRDGAVGLRAYASTAAAGGSNFMFYNWTARTT
jgi:hypothetical protein